MNADIHGLSGAYAVDALDDTERAAFERHLAQCPECQAEVASLRAAATELSALSRTPPPESLRASVLAGIATVRPLPPLAPDAPAAEPGTEPAAEPELAPVRPLIRRRPRTSWLLATAAAVAVALGGLAWHPWDRGSSGQLTASEQVLRAGDAQRMQKVIDGARATIVRSASLGRAVLVADHMPPAPAGKDYQLWLDMPGEGMVSAGLMPRDGGPTVTVPLKGDARLAKGAGITVEPAGGSAKPTTQPIALFSFS